MRIAELRPEALSWQLAGPGLGLCISPYVVNVVSPFRRVREGIRLLYSDFEIAEPGAFTDFHVRVGPPASARRWLGKQALFSVDGRQPFKPLPAEQAFPMMEWGLNWVVSNNAHDHLILHAAVVAREDRAMLMAAPPGSGKSTLCAALVRAGWRLLSDELALIDLGDGSLTPLARPISLKNRSIGIVRGFGNDIVIGPECEDTGKGTVAHMKPPRDSVERSRETAVPAWIVFPKYREDAQLRFVPGRKAASFMELVKNAFNYAVLGEDAFDALADLVDRCRIYHLEYGHLDQALPALARLPG